MAVENITLPVLFIDKTMDSWGDRIDGMAYDNIDDFFQGSSVWDNSVSVSGGSKNGSFYLSGSIIISPALFLQLVMTRRLSALMVNRNTAS